MTKQRHNGRDATILSPIILLIIRSLVWVAGAIKQSLPRYPAFNPHQR